MDEKESHPEGYKPITHHREEERYFFEHDLELIRELRKRADEGRRSRELDQQKKLHWMRCPKCGSSMEEVRFDALVLDRCGTCGGVYFDDGELEILQKLAEEGGQDTTAVLARLIETVRI